VKKLSNYRKEFDKIDLQILYLLGKRMKLSKKIGKYKKQNGFSVFDSKREKKVYSNLKKYAKKKNLDEKFVEKLFKLIIMQSKKKQR